MTIENKNVTETDSVNSEPLGEYIDRTYPYGRHVGPHIRSVSRIYRDGLYDYQFYHDFCEWDYGTVDGPNQPTESDSFTME